MTEGELGRQNFESFLAMCSGIFFIFLGSNLFLCFARRALKAAVTDDSKVPSAAAENTRLKAPEMKKKL
jgi:hypothetical protein